MNLERARFRSWWQPPRASVFHLVEHAGEGPAGSVRWILVGSIALVLVCIAGIMHVVRVTEIYARSYQVGSVVLVVAGVVAVMTALVPFEDVVPLLGVVLGVLAIPMVAGVVVWQRIRAMEHGSSGSLATQPFSRESASTGPES